MSDFKNDEYLYIQHTGHSNVYVVVKTEEADEQSIKDYSNWTLVKVIKDEQ